MADFIQKPDSGSTFKNLKKTEETHANYTGTALVGGVEYWMNTWVNKDKNGNPWFAHLFKVKGERPAKQEAAAPAKAPAKPARGFDDLDDGIPF